MPGRCGQLTRRRRLSSAAVLACAVLLSALLCGCGAGARTPSLQRVPLVGGLHLITRQRICDKGRNAYCAIAMVMSAPDYASSQELQKAERLLLKKRGWVKVNAPVGQELGADSPGDHLRLTYAAANLELEAIDLGWVKRPRPIALALSRQLFNHASALAMLLQMGTT
jgi:hypothetical protein